MSWNESRLWSPNKTIGDTSQPKGPARPLIHEEMLRTNGCGSKSKSWAYAGVGLSFQGAPKTGPTFPSHGET